LIPCPSCQQSIEILDIHKGTLFTCPLCNSVYFIDWEGQPELPSQIEVPQIAEEALAEEPSPITLDNSDFSDVAEFGNADVVINPMSYTILIEGLESSRVVSQLKDAMTDSRFGWDVNEILSQINADRLVLSHLTPAKASVIINRIKYLPVKVSWRQDVLSVS
jgi:hypothetical protein